MKPAEAYQRVNGTWPEGPLPKMTRVEAERAGRKLFRFVTGKPFQGTLSIGRGNHRSRVRGGTFMRVNPGQGWHDMVHDLSHDLHHIQHPSKRPHDGTHAFMEREMIEFVVSNGWLDGKLRPPVKPKPDPRKVRAARVAESIQRWQRKKKRAETALRKLIRQQRYYARTLGQGGDANA